MTTAHPQSSPGPRWDNRNEGFVSPARLQQWKQENERIHSFGNSSQSPLSSPPQDLTVNRSTPERRNISNESQSSANGSPGKHRSKPSFASFFSRKSVNLDDLPVASPPPTQPSQTAEASIQPLQRPVATLSPQRVPSGDDAAMQNPPQMAQQPPQQQQGPPPTQPSANPAASPQAPPLHPEIRSVVQLTLAHAQKVYFSGPLVRQFERQPDGQKPAKDEGWREVWAQLGGTTLSIWDMEGIQEASKLGKQLPPSYINVTDAFVHVLGSIAIPPTPGAPPRRYTNVLTLNTAGSNLYLFSCPSPEALIQWTAAIRLASWEKSRLEEIYTAHLIRITLNDGRSTPSPLMGSRLEGWVRVRIAGQTDWKRLWMVISAGNNLGHPDHGSISSAGHDRPESPNATRKKRMSNLFSRDKSPVSNLPARPLIQLFTSSRQKDKKKALLTMRNVSQAFAVYPERPELISRSTLMKLEGKLGDEEMAGVLKAREAWLLVMPELEGTNTRASEMLKWTIAIHDAFQLYGRPEMYSWDPRDIQSMMFAYPIGPRRDSLFLDRELAESLDPRDDRTSMVRSQLQQILLNRMNAPTVSAVASQGPPTLPPLPDVAAIDERPQSQSPPRAQPSAGNGQFSLPPLNFDARPAEDRRPLTPITERSFPLGSQSSERSPGIAQPGKTVSPPAVVSEESASILQQPLVTSPTATTPPSDQTMFERGSVDSYSSTLSSRPNSKLGQVAKAPSRSPSSHLSSPALPSEGARQQTSPAPRPSTPPTPPRFATASPRPFSPPRTASPLRATSPPQPQPSMTAPTLAPSSLRMVPDRSISQTSIPTSLKTIPTPPHATDSVPSIPTTPLASPSLPASPLQQTTRAHQKKGSLTDDILGDAGAALFYMQHMQKQDSAVPVRKRGPPPPSHDDDGEDDVDDDDNSVSESESEPYTPPQRTAPSPLRVRQASSPPPPATTQPPAVPAKSPTVPPKSPKPRTKVDQVPPRVSEASAAPRPSGSLRNRPSGARAAPTTRTSAYLQNSSAADHTPTESTATTTPDKSDDSDAMASTAVPQAAKYEDNADALAALSFLEQEDRPAPSSIPQSTSSRGPQSPPLPEVIETPASPSQTRPVASDTPRSSFAPTRLAAERKAKSQAQQAAQQAAAHRPGKANGRGKTKPRDRGAWGDSSDEDDEEEEDDEDVDSDAEPQLRSGVSVSDHASSTGPGRSPYAQMGGASPARSANDVPSTGYPSPHRPRDLPQVPGGQMPDEYLGAQPPSRRYAPDNFNDPGRRSLHPAEGSGSRGPSPQFGQTSMRPQSQFPIQQPQFQQPQRQIWSQVLDPDRHVEPTNGRDTFVQLEAPATTMTKAFTPHGLLSAGLQDRQDRSAKKQEELARETGASLINVPNKPPPPQTGLLGAVTAHERERKREGGIGAALTEREREKRIAEERQRKLDELQRQQLDQMQQGGSMYGGGMMGYNPMMANPMMMGMNPMMTGGWGFPGMMPGFANPQQLFAAQQAAQQAYQSAMYAFSTAGSQIAGNDGQPGQGPMNPMMTGNSMGAMGGFDPRMSMMGMPMMNPGMGMNPMGMTPTGMSGMGGGMGGMSGMGGMGMNPMMGAGMNMQMTGTSQFDPRFSPGLESATRGQQGDPNVPGSRPFSSQGGSSAPGLQASAAGAHPASSDASPNASGPPSTVQ